MIDESLEVLLHWVVEREAIRERKEAGRPFPWTDDTILRTWRFCNVRREDDRVTRWIDENIRRPFAGHEDLWFMLCAARMINWPPTLEELICTHHGHHRFGGWPSHDNFDPRTMGEILENMKSAGRKVFTGAYIIPAPTTAGQTKDRYIAETVLGNLWRDRERFTNLFTQHSPRTLHGMHAMLTAYTGWGPFLAYQAVVDMRFTSILENAPDVWTWCACGPGTIRGLNRLHGRALSAVPHRDRLLHEVRFLFPLIRAWTGIVMDFSDVPNVLCEFDKYSRVRLGQGVPRARYVPGRGS